MKKRRKTTTTINLEKPMPTKCTVSTSMMIGQLRFHSCFYSFCYFQLTFYVCESVPGYKKVLSLLHSCVSFDTTNGQTNVRYQQRTNEGGGGRIFTKNVRLEHCLMRDRWSAA
jgi:hypothetical protein